MPTVSKVVFSWCIFLGTLTKLPQHTALPEDPPSIPGLDDTLGLDPYLNLNPEIIEETHHALNTAPPSGWPEINHISSPESPINASSQGPSIHLMSSHTISGVSFLSLCLQVPPPLSPLLSPKCTLPTVTLMPS